LNKAEQELFEKHFRELKLQGRLSREDALALWLAGRRSHGPVVAELHRAEVMGGGVHESWKDYPREYGFFRMYRDETACSDRVAESPEG